MQEEMQGGQEENPYYKHNSSKMPPSEKGSELNSFLKSFGEKSSAPLSDPKSKEKEAKEGGKSGGGWSGSSGMNMINKLFDTYSYMTKNNSTETSSPDHGLSGASAHHAQGAQPAHKKKKFKDFDVSSKIFGSRN
mmetsp:Transcript_1973/g.3467  ORF Transcript_1973/g.3467 Transcript_1973/m.3467 type:complete len:135 (-) Transcript_1973:1708-2112(-)